MHEGRNDLLLEVEAMEGNEVSVERAVRSISSSLTSGNLPVERAVHTSATVLYLWTTAV